MKPTLGRIVHYFDPDSKKILAGIVTSFEENDKFNITVFYPSGETSARFSLTVDEDQAKIPKEAKIGQWFWPPMI